MGPGLHGPRQSRDRTGARLTARAPEQDRVARVIEPGLEVIAPTGPASSVHEAELDLPSELGPSPFSQAFTERVAVAYWRFLSRAGLGLLRIRVGPVSEEVGLVLRRPVLLRFAPARHDHGPDWAEIRWSIANGLLVARRGRGHGSLVLRFDLLDPRDRDGRRARVLARVEVDGYQPAIRGSGRFAQVGSWLYAHTQARVHRRLARGFLLSLVDLEPGPGGARAWEGS
jgi:hypothetical protein